MTYGGHHMAAGLRLETNLVDQFRDRLCSVVGQTLAADDLVATLDIDAVCTRRRRRPSCLSRSTASVRLEVATPGRSSASPRQRSLARATRGQPRQPPQGASVSPNPHTSRQSPLAKAIGPNPCRPDQRWTWPLNRKSPATWADVTPSCMLKTYDLLTAAPSTLTDHLFQRYHNSPYSTVKVNK